eukprot:TRINITY_DN9137_c0_g1_i1.p2 TRINITY_DN9137_c0_g1~~TRINITY_DN9137_c0_g1_i1.p2  ORF type:complete len:117 (+),score=28.15 TRINITY_DN9137_c0_g1_i1:3-353(+)
MTVSGRLSGFIFRSVFSFAAFAYAFAFFSFFFFSSRRRHTRCREVSWARRCVQETGSLVFLRVLFKQSCSSFFCDYHFSVFLSFFFFLVTCLRLFLFLSLFLLFCLSPMYLSLIHI